MGEIKICPSILSADFSKLGADIEAVDQAGADWIHIDVMDGHFVPNITFGPSVVAAVRSNSKQFFDVHLMISEPLKYVDEFIKAGADGITIHAETVDKLEEAVSYLKAKDIKVGISVKPNTPVESIFSVLSQLDMVLIMTVEPGFGGQAFIESTHEKIQTLRSKIQEEELSVDIQVDGGITCENIGKVAASGANLFVAGSTVFKASDWKKTIQTLREKAEANF